MPRSRNFFFLTATLALTGVLMLACDSGTQEPAAEPSEAATSDSTGQADESVAIPEVVSSEAAEIPETFPDEVPIYPGSNTAQGKGALVDGAPIAAIQLKTSDSPEEVYEYYAEKFARDGWTIEDGQDLRGKNAVSATNGECKVSMLAAPDDSGRTAIFIITEC